MINILIKQLQPSNEGAPLHERIPLVKQVGPASVPTVGRLGGKQIIVFMSCFYLL